MSDRPAPLQRLLRRLDLDATSDPTRWVGHAGGAATTTGTRVYGGLVIAQTIVAASRAMPDRSIHSLQHMFFREGRQDIPIEYRVDSLYEGRTFASARVEVWQDDAMISHAQLGLTKGGGGPTLRQPMPDALAPEEGVDRDAHRSNGLAGDVPVECRIDVAQHDAATPELDMWMRAEGATGLEPIQQNALLGYGTDRAMLGLPAMWTGKSRDGGFFATLNHGIWFHDELDFGAWHLHAMRASILHDARGTITGQIFSQDGTLVASTAQEGVIRFGRSEYG